MMGVDMVDALTNELAKQLSESINKTIIDDLMKLGDIDNENENP